MKTLSLLLLAALAVLAVLAAAQGSMAEQDHIFTTLLQQQQQPQEVPSQHESVWEPAFPTPSELLSEKKTGATKTAGRSTAIALQFDEGAYFGEISLGTPPQSFRMLLSMVFTTVWIPNFAYSAANRHYNHTQSSTYTANGTVFAIRGLLGGFLSQDTMKIGDLEIEHQGFAEINAINDKVLPPTKFPRWDGVFGLGFDFRGDASQIKMPFHSLVDSGVLSEPLFALHFDKHAGKGVMTIGATDPSHYTGELVYAEVIRRDSWTVKLDDIRVAGKNMTKHRRATFWADFPGLQGPKNDVAALAEAVGAKLVGLRYELDCSSQGPDIEILIGGARFVLSKSDYTGRVLSHSTAAGGGGGGGDGTVCQWAIQNSIFGLDAWLFGGTFMEKVYSVFHWGDPEHDGRGRKMGFALRA